MKTVLKKIVPRPARAAITRLRKSIRYRGRDRYCPVCKHYSNRFDEFGTVLRRSDALCGWCGSLERFRLVWLYYERKTDLFSGKAGRKMLHIAPELCFEPVFRKAIGEGYVSGDLFGDNVDVNMDVTDIPFPDDHFDIIHCSHVLEHVPDDKKAMREFRRVLKPGGWAMLQVPVTGEKTFEDPSVTDPAERVRLFDQEDHVRKYGPDFLDRLVEQGFDVTCIRPADFLPEDEIEKIGVTNKITGELYLCRKPETGDSATA